MPQIFQVLRCYKCLIFQVHQTKKLNKWECKLCGEKQSHKRHYGLGSGKDCRLYVQKLNSLHANMNDQNNYTESDEDLENNDDNTKENLRFVQSKKESKWDDYLDKTEPIMSELMEEESIMCIDDKKVIFEIPKKRRKLNGKDYHRNKNTTLNSMRDMDTVDNQNVNAEKEVDLPNDRIVNKLEEKIVARKSLKFVPPKINVNSKWTQFNEETKNINEKIDSTCNTFTINNKEPKKARNDFTTIPNINNHSKWTKLFTDDDDFNDNNLKSSLNKNPSKYEPNTSSSTLKNSKDCSEYLLYKNVCSKKTQNISNNNIKKSTVTSLFDDGDLDVLDM